MAKQKDSSKKKKDRPRKKSTLHSETKKGIVVIACFTLALLSLLSYFEAAGAFGGYFLKLGQMFFGRGFFLIPLGLILAGFSLLTFSKEKLGGHGSTYGPVAIGLALFIFSILGIFHIFGNQEQSAVLSGGYLGLLIGWPLNRFLGFWAGLLVLLAIFLISILIIFNIPLRKRKEEFKELQKEEREGEDVSEPVESFNTVKEKETEEDYYPRETEKKLSLWKKLKEKIEYKNEELKTETKKDDYSMSGDKQNKAPLVFQRGRHSLKLDNFQLPTLDLLEKDKGQPTSGDIKANVNIIQRTLQNFGIEVEMAEVNIGPTVTQFTLRPAQGVKLSRITALHNDLALALAAHPLRIEAPIPGRSLIGIEIPNRSAILVRLRNLLESPVFKESSSLLSFSLGRNVAGRPVFADLSRMPHLLIAGATGAGKTITINSLIISLLYQNSPKTLNFILIDPKRVEFTPYNDIPHLLTPVIVQSDKALNALRWAIGEMERRFDILQQSGARDIFSHNKKQRADEIMPYIAIIIDELADLMASRGREVEAVIVRLAQMARAVGIHLVVATQRPSVEVITGLIKANITSRIALQAASQIDSRTILDAAGAEKLLGQGDMLYLSGDSAKPRRIQGTYVSDKEIKKVVNFLRKNQGPEYNQSVADIEDASGFYSRASASVLRRGAAAIGSSDMPGTDDELYEEAREVISQAGRASASLLQRRLRIGYARAARLLDMLEQAGEIGPAEGAKAREVLTRERDEID